MHINSRMSDSALATLDLPDSWEGSLPTPPNVNPSEKFIRHASNINSGRPILVGRDYQAAIPPYIGSTRQSIGSGNEYRSEVTEMQCWSYNVFRQQHIPESLLDEFCRLCKEKHDFEVDQSLTFLHASNYNIKEAYTNIDQYTAPQRHKWEKADRIVFNACYQFFGRDFESIKALLKEKSYAELIEYFYIVYKRKKYIFGDVSSSESSLNDSFEFKSPASDDSDSSSRRSKRSAIQKAQSFGPKSKTMVNPKVTFPTNGLCTFSKPQLRDLHRGHNQPWKIRVSITKLQKELKRQ